MGTRFIEAEMETDLVPSPAQYSVLLPDQVGSGAPLPLLLFLHGGAGSRDFLRNMRGLIESSWERGVLPPMLVATPSAARGFYMDYRDGSQRWESFILGPLVDLLRKQYGCRTDAAGTFALADKDLIAKTVGNIPARRHLDDPELLSLGGLFLA